MTRVYDLCENHDFMNAMEKCLEVITEIKMAYNAINHKVHETQNLIGIWENK